VDDLRPLPAWLRFLVQIVASAAFLWLVGIPKAILLPGLTITMPAVLVGALLVIWMTGVLNIYNFMDGMDGLAGAQAVSAGSAIAITTLITGTSELGVIAATLAAASGGFLMHNFPPARIFMGDAGSTFVGFVLAGLAVLGLHHDVPFAVTALAITPFLLDGTFTICRRALKREPIWRAHRSHLYQRAVQTGLGHREVLLVYVGWMGIAAGGAIAHPIVGWVASLITLVVVWWWVVRRESQKVGAS
jgi:UDP-N-acetylmuramyl pentapeptide phosphotransferase/UDP-N-acetylglucosamine-1-phosphate transferase